MMISKESGEVFFNTGAPARREVFTDYRGLLWPKWWPGDAAELARDKRLLERTPPEKWNKKQRAINRFRESRLLDEAVETQRQYEFEMRHRPAYSSFAERVEAADKAWEQQQIARELTMSNGDVV